MSSFIIFLWLLFIKTHGALYSVILINLIHFQIDGWVSTNWRSNPSRHHEDSEVDPIRHCDGLLYHGLRIHLVSLHPVLHDWRRDWGNTCHFIKQLKSTNVLRHMTRVITEENTLTQCVSAFIRIKVYMLYKYNYIWPS